VTFGGNNFTYFSKNQLTKLAHLVQFKRVFMFCPEDWGAGVPDTHLATTLNNSVKHWPIIIIFGTQHRKETLRK